MLVSWGCQGKVSDACTGAFSLQAPLSLFPSPKNKTKSRLPAFAACMASRFKADPAGESSHAAGGIAAIPCTTLPSFSPTCHVKTRQREQNVHQNQARRHENEVGRWEKDM